MSDSALNELGFAEFVAKLISDTFSAVLTAQSDQKEKLNELRRLVSTDTDGLVSQFIGDETFLEQTELRLQNLFPFDNEIGHAIFEGAPYQAATARKTESPSIQPLLGIEMIKGDDYSDKGITAKGVEKIKYEVMAQLTDQQRGVLAEILTDGIPKLVIDGGKINAKLTFRTELNDTLQEEVPQETSNTTSTTENSFSRTQPTLSKNLLLAKPLYGVIDSQKLLNTRLTITPASNKAPQDAQTTANIYSEIEIHFKTIL